MCNVLKFDPSLTFVKMLWQNNLKNLAHFEWKKWNTFQLILNWLNIIQSHGQLSSLGDKLFSPKRGSRIVMHIHCIYTFKTCVLRIWEREKKQQLYEILSKLPYFLEENIDLPYSWTSAYQSQLYEHIDNKTWSLQMSTVLYFSNKEKWVLHDVRL